jgi:hypothetical protein
MGFGEREIRRKKKKKSEVLCDHSPRSAIRPKRVTFRKLGLAIAGQWNTTANLFQTSGD